MSEKSKFLPELEIKKILAEALERIQKLEEDKKKITGTPALQLTPPGVTAEDNTQRQKAIERIDEIIQQDKLTTIKTIEEKAKNLPIDRQALILQNARKDLGLEKDIEEIKTLGSSFFENLKSDKDISKFMSQPGKEKDKDDILPE